MKNYHIPGAAALAFLATMARAPAQEPASDPVAACKQEFLSFDADRKVWIPAWIEARAAEERGSSNQVAAIGQKFMTQMLGGKLLDVMKAAKQDAASCSSDPESATQDLLIQHKVMQIIVTGPGGLQQLPRRRQVEGDTVHL